MEVKRYIAPAIVILLIAGYFGPGLFQEWGFDEVCDIYTEAQARGLEKMDRIIFIVSNVEKRVIASHALTAHHAVMLSDPERRYPLFKEAAEMSLEKPWECRVMKEMLQ